MEKTQQEINHIYGSLYSQPKEHTFIIIKNMYGSSFFISFAIYILNILK